jgi:hypothetical protein
MSIISGGWRPAGQDTDQGFVPMTFLRPPQGAIAGPPLVASIITQPSAAAMRV